jgi:hypothetical protein
MSFDQMARGRAYMRLYQADLEKGEKDKKVRESCLAQDLCSCGSEGLVIDMREGRRTGHGD